MLERTEARRPVVSTRPDPWVNSCVVLLFSRHKNLPSEFTVTAVQARAFTNQALKTGNSAALRVGSAENKNSTVKDISQTGLLQSMRTWVSAYLTYEEFINIYAP